MHPFQLLFLLFLIVPVVEIYFLIQVGSVIGALPTVFLVVFTAVLGVFLLRIQGFSTLTRVRKTMEQGGIPALEMLEGAVLLVAGALLLTPGFFTDAIGFLCLIPAFRRSLVKWFLGRVLVSFNADAQQTQQAPPGGQPKRPPKGAGHGPSGSPHAPRTIEGEYRREDD